jgi:hypothetical protein
MVVQLSLPQILEEIEHGFARKRLSTRSVNRRLIWHLHILSGAVRAARDDIREFGNDIVPLLSSLLSIQQKDCQKASRRFLKSFFTATWGLNWKHVQLKDRHDYPDGSEFSDGRYHPEDIHVKWYIPGTAVSQLGISVANQIIQYTTEQLEKASSSTSPHVESKDDFAYLLRLLGLLAGAAEKSSLLQLSRRRQQSM